MKKIIILIALGFASILFLHSQTSIDRLLERVEANNTQLKALRELSTAEKLENKTSNNLVNPEVEVVHKPKARGNYAETGIEATQSFDFPTAYKHRSQTIELQNQRVDLAYRQKRTDVLYEARLLVIEYVYCQKQLEYMQQRADYAKELHTAYEKLFAIGDINVLERNKTKLNLLEAQKDLQMVKANLQAAATELARMNGGEVIDSYPDAYSSYPLPLEFDSWFAKIRNNNPSMLMADKNIETSRKQEQLARSLNLPKLTAGYVGDFVRNDSRHGFLVSVSVPLWEGRNTIKSKKAQTIAMQYEKDDAEQQYQNKLRVSFDKAQKLSVLLKDYSEIIDNSNNFMLLKKSFDMGQLSLIEYLQELIIYHEAVENYYATEKDYNIVISELEQWEN